MTKVLQKGWKLIKGNRPMTYEEWSKSVGSFPLNDKAVLDRRFGASTWVIYLRIASLDWYDRTVLGLPQSRPMSVVEIAKLEGHTRQTIHNHLKVLVATGWAEKVGAGKYRPLQVCPDLPKRKRSVAI